MQFVQEKLHIEGLLCRNFEKEKPICNYTVQFHLGFKCVLVLHSVDLLAHVINRSSDMKIQVFMNVLYLHKNYIVMRLYFNNMLRRSEK